MSSVSQKNPVRIFVAHLWHADHDYQRIFEYLESVNNFYYINTSLPDNLPSGGREAQKEELRQQISAAECMVLPAALHGRNQDIVDFMLHCAKAFDKPIIVLEPFGAKETIPKAVMEFSDEVVPWDQRQLIDAIKRQARHEESTRFDVIDFTLD